MMLLWLVLAGSALVAVHTVPIPLRTALNPGNNQTDDKYKYACLTDDVLHRDGDVVPSGAACSQCVCRAPDVVCSPVKCEKKPGCRALQRSNQCCPEYKCECERDGRIYNNGEKLESPESPCEVCYCRGGEVVCTPITCYKRDDCQPQEVPGRCCPKYDHCPPINSNRDNGHLMTIRPTIQTTNFRFVTSSLASSLSTNSVHGRHPFHDADNKYDTTRFQLLGEVHPDTQAPLEEGTTSDPSGTVKMSTVTKDNDEETMESAETRVNVGTKSTTSLPDNKAEATKHESASEVESLPVTTEDGSEETKQQDSTLDTANVQIAKEFGTETEERNDQDNVAENSEHSAVQVTKYSEVLKKEGSDNETLIVEKLDGVDMNETTGDESSIAESFQKSRDDLNLGQEYTTTSGDVATTNESDGNVTEESVTTEPTSLSDENNSTEQALETSSENVLTSVSVNSTTPVPLTSEPWEHHRPTQMVTDDIQYVTTVEPIVPASESKASTEPILHDTGSTGASSTTQDEKLGENDGSSDTSSTEGSQDETTTPEYDNSTEIDNTEDTNLTMRFNRLGETEIDDSDNNVTVQTSPESTERSNTSELEEEFTTIETTTDDAVTEETGDEESATESSATDEVDESTPTIPVMDVDSPEESTTEMPAESRTEETIVLSTELITSSPDDVDMSPTEMIVKNKDDHLTPEGSDQLPVLKLSEEMTQHQMDFVIHHISMPAENDESMEESLPISNSVTEKKEPTTDTGVVSEVVSTEEPRESNSHSSTNSTDSNVELTETTTEVALDEVLKTSNVENDTDLESSEDNTNSTPTSEERGTNTSNGSEDDRDVTDISTQTEESGDEIEVHASPEETDAPNTVTEQETNGVTVTPLETITTNVPEGTNELTLITADEKQKIIEDVEVRTLKETGDVIEYERSTTEHEKQDETNITEIQMESTTETSETTEDAVQKSSMSLNVTESSKETDGVAADKRDEDKLSDSVENTTDSNTSTEVNTENNNTEVSGEIEKLTLSTTLPEESTEIEANSTTGESSTTITEPEIVDITETNTTMDEVPTTISPIVVTQDNIDNSTDVSTSTKDITNLSEISTVESIEPEEGKKLKESSGIENLIKFNEQFMSNRTSEQSTSDDSGLTTPESQPMEVTTEIPGVTSTTEGGMTDDLAWVHLLGGKQIGVVEKSTETSTLVNKDNENAIQNSTLFVVSPFDQLSTVEGDTRFLSTLIQNAPIEYDDTAKVNEDKREVIFTDSFGNVEESPGYFQDPNIYNSNTHTILTNLQRDDAHELGRYDLALLQNFFKNLYIHDDRSGEVVS